MRSDRMYENFISYVEWVYLGPGGNSGVFLWSDAIPGKNRLPLEMEVEMLELDWPKLHKKKDGTLPLITNRLRPRRAIRLRRHDCHPGEPARHT